MATSDKAKLDMLGLEDNLFKHAKQGRSENMHWLKNLYSNFLRDDIHVRPNPTGDCEI
jgi:hypothetical protein